MSEQFTYYGHSALGLNINGIKILVDPWFNGNPMTNVCAAEVEADYILVTHGHGDHLGDTVAIAKRCNATLIAMPEILRWTKSFGVKDHPLQLGGGFQFSFGYLKMTVATHSSSLPDGSFGGEPVGYLLRTPNGKKVYMAGDTGLFGDMGFIGEEGLDLAALPIGDNYTMGPDDALRAVKLLSPRRVVPIHYNSFDLIKQDPEAWAKRVNEQTQSRAIVLKAGESLELE